MRHVLTGTIATALLTSACSQHVVPTVAPERQPAPVERIERRMILFVPPEFAEYAYVGRSDWHKLRYEFGTAATQSLTTLLVGTFDSVEVRAIASETAFYALLGGDRSEFEMFDYLAMPRFLDGGQQKTFYQGVDVHIKVDFVPRAGVGALSVEGTGSAKTSPRSARRSSAARGRFIGNGRILA